MFLLVGASVNGNIALTEDQASSIGIAVLLPVVAVAVGLFIVSGHALKRFERIKKNPTATATTGRRTAMPMEPAWSSVRAMQLLWDCSSYRGMR